jgi:metal-responsive CopG/Arc/MetJ family transcriptional regulator
MEEQKTSDNQTVIITIAMPISTLKQLDGMAETGKRSAFIRKLIESAWEANETVREIYSKIQ